MRNSPRFLLWLIVILILVSLFIVMPPIQKVSFGKFNIDINFDQNAILKKLHINKDISFHRGLDLAGGTSLTFRADMSGISTNQKAQALEAEKTVIERRVNFFGVSEPIVQTATVNGDSRIIVELPNVDIDSAKNIIGTTAKLSFWEQGSASNAASVKSNLAIPSGLTQILGQNAHETNLSGGDLQDTNVTFDQNTGKPQVQLNFTSKGAQKFADITKRNVNKILAIVLDNEVIEAPKVNEPILTGDAVITGNFTFENAKALSTQLNAGALPVPLIPLQQHAVDSTLGASSLQMSLFAFFLGFVTIVIFMSVLYGRLGMLASVALFLYTLFVLALFKLIPVTLTLAGIAGFILSIGMAVDANILIFERMKEERRQGKRKEVAMEIGFSRAWTSIRDSNISTLITSAILYKFGTGMVRGFALVLAIGVLVSMFSAIVMTRTFLRVIYRTNN